MTRAEQRKLDQLVYGIECVIRAFDVMLDRDYVTPEIARHIFAELTELSEELDTIATVERHLCKPTV